MHVVIEVFLEVLRMILKSKDLMQFKDIFANTVFLFDKNEYWRINCNFQICTNYALRHKEKPLQGETFPKI